MAAPVGESFLSGFETSEVTDTADALVFDALAHLLGKEVNLRHCEALWRKDYEGDASNKCYVGGALLLTYTVFGERFTEHELEVTEDMFEPQIKQAMEDQARQNWRAGSGWVRDYGRGNPTSR